MGGLCVYSRWRRLLAERLNRMLRLVDFAEPMREEWDRFAARHGTVYHTIGFRQILLHSFGYQCAYQAVIDEQNRICGLLPLVLGRGLNLQRTGVSLPFVNQLELCAETEAVRSFLIENLKVVLARYRLNRLQIRLTEQQNRQMPGWREDGTQYTFSLPLLGDEEQTFSQASASCRNHVRKTYRNHWFAASFEPARLADYYRVYVRRMKQLGSPAPSLSFFQAFFQFLPNQTHLLTVLDQQTGLVVGGMLLLVSRADQTLYYPYGASLVEYNSRYLNSFMYWEAAKFAIQQKLHHFDLGRSPAESGTFRYKQQWGALPIRLRYLELTNTTERSAAEPIVPLRDRLTLFIELWKHLPRGLTDRVGERIIPYLFP